MATFGITPVTGYPLPPSDSFPQFIQFQEDAVDLGGPDADTVNFAGDLVATRGTGENANTVTVSVTGTAGGTVTSVELATPTEFTVTGSPITVSGTLTVAKATQVKNTAWAGPTSGADAQPTFRALVDADLPVAARAFTWNTPAAGSYTLALTDAENGVALQGGTLTIPPHSSVAFPDGTSIVLNDIKYSDPFQIAAGAGVTLKYRSVFLPASAGEEAVVTLIQRGLNTWVLCGDLEPA